MVDAASHCEALVREADKDRFLATLFAPAAVRPHLFALYAFDAEVGRVRTLAREPMPGEIRLQWWEDALSGLRPVEARAHPVASALLDAMAAHRLPIAPLTALIEARRFDLYDDPMETSGELEAYCEQTSSTLFGIAAQMLTPPDANLAAAARHVGIAFGLTALLRGFALHASRQQLYVPLDLLARHGVHTAEVLAGRGGAGLAAALAELRGRVREHLKSAAGPVASIDRTAVPALLPAALVRLYLAVMERDGYDPFRTPVEMPQWRRQWALWRAARRLDLGLG